MGGGEGKKVFFFDLLISGEKKSGQIESDDILKAFIKLKDTLHYDVRAIYDRRESTEEEKTVSMKQVTNLYNLYREQHGKEIEQAKRLSEKREAEGKKVDELKTTVSEDDINSSIKREIDRYHGLIQKSLDRTVSILDTNSESLTEKQRTDLKTIADELRQARNITNADRLRIIGQESLLKVGQIQMELIEAKKIERQRSYFIETNQLLRGFGSRDKIVLPEDDFKKKFKKFLDSMIDRFTIIENNAEALDRKSFAYFQKVSELGVYRKKLKEVDRDIFANLLSFPTLRKLIMKRRVILQNIHLLKKRINRKSFSYTKILRGVRYYEDVLFGIVADIGNTITYALALFGLYYAAIRIVSAVALSDTLFISSNIHHLVSFFAAFALALLLSRRWWSFLIVMPAFAVFFVFFRINF
jgi:hypothetical protein